MIVAVRANRPSFKEVTFSSGFNVVLADRTKASTQRDSRNGLGKTTLVEIIHFCLGSSIRKGHVMRSDHLKGWSFTLDLLIGGTELSVTRSVDNPRGVSLEGDVSGLDLREPEWREKKMLPFALSLELAEPLANRRRMVSTSDWISVLGNLLFGLTVEDTKAKYQPTFRSLFSYMARHGREGFISPFSSHSRERVGVRQVNNAFLLGLSWEHARRFQELKDEEKALNSVRNAAQQGLLQGIVGSLGPLEAERTRLAAEYARQRESLRNFRVHSEYSAIDQEANDLTATIQELKNSNFVDAGTLALYYSSLNEENAPEAAEVLSVYRAVGRTMPGLVSHQLEEVERFHEQLLTNRREYLQSEVQRLTDDRTKRDNEILRLSDRRARLMNTLRVYGALEEYNELQERHMETSSELEGVNGRIENLKRFEAGMSDVRLRRERLLQTARREFEERRHTRETAISLFNANSQALYEAPGNLVLEITDTGFEFDVEIMRSGSQGIENMKIFCYDLMLAQLWAERRPSAAIMIHDSTIFDGVDERQVAKGLELVAREAETRDFQYICALNTDTMPSRDFTSGFDLGRYVRLRLTDESESGGLLGIRY